MKCRIATVLITLTLDEAETVRDAIAMAIDGGALEERDRMSYEPSGDDDDAPTEWEVDAARMREIVEAIAAAGDILCDSHAGEVHAGLASDECVAGLEMIAIAEELRAMLHVAAVLL